MTPAVSHGTALDRRRRVVQNRHSIHRDDWGAGAQCRLESKIGVNYIKIHLVKN